MVLLSLAAGLAMAGCGSGSGSNRPATVPGVAYPVADKIKAGMQRADVNRRLGKPILTSRPTDSAANGCVYYAMEGRPPADVWEFCFGRRNRVDVGATLYSPSQPAPPAGASAARAALLARGDTICQGERADLAHPVERLNRQLAKWRRNPNRANRRRAARLIGRFDAVLKKTLAELSVFDIPPDRRSALGDYLGALRAQTRVLARTKTALATAKDQRYLRLVHRFNALGDAATAHARQYGFSACFGTTFS